MISEFRYPDPVHEQKEGKYHKARKGEQGDAPIILRRQ